MTQFKVVGQGHKVT